MFVAVKKFSESNEDLDSFGLAVLSHGKDGDIIYGTDREISIKVLIEPIKKCEKLIRKPKIFIIQVVAELFVLFLLRVAS
jgi:hypothetical protein